MALKWVVLGIAVLMYALVILFQEKKVWFTSVAALVVVLLGTKLKKRQRLRLPAKMQTGQWKTL